MTRRGDDCWNGAETAQFRDPQVIDNFDFNFTRR